MTGLTYQSKIRTRQTSTCVDQLFLLAFCHTFQFLSAKFLFEKELKTAMFLEPILLTTLVDSFSVIESTSNHMRGYQQKHRIKKLTNESVTKVPCSISVCWGVSF